MRNIMFQRKIYTLRKKTKEVGVRRCSKTKLATLLKKRLRHRCFLAILQSLSEQPFYRTNIAAASEIIANCSMHYFLHLCIHVSLLKFSP